MNQFCWCTNIQKKFVILLMHPKNEAELNGVSFPQINKPSLFIMAMIEKKTNSLNLYLHCCIGTLIVQKEFLLDTSKPNSSKNNKYQFECKNFFQVKNLASRVCLQLYLCVSPFWHIKFRFIEKLKTSLFLKKLSRKQFCYNLLSIFQYFLM